MTQTFMINGDKPTPLQLQCQPYNGCILALQTDAQKALFEPPQTTSPDAEKWVRDNTDRHRQWPAHFSVMTSTGKDVPSPGLFNAGFAAKIKAMTGPDDFLKLISAGFSVQKTYSSDLFWGALVAMGIMDDGPYDCTPRCEMSDQTTEQVVGDSVGFVYNPSTVAPDAERRYLLVIHSNVYDEWFRDGQAEAEKGLVQTISTQYQLPSDHVRSIEPPLSIETIRAGLRAFTSKLPVDTKAEVMVLYTAHGGVVREDDGRRYWQTKLHDGFLWFNTVASESEFITLFSKGLPSNRISSVLFLVESCYSGLLIDGM